MGHKTKTDMEELKAAFEIFLKDQSDGSGPLPPWDVVEQAVSHSAIQALTIIHIFGALCHATSL
jgi:hypothetical protein